MTALDKSGILSFLPTPSARRATSLGYNLACSGSHFYPRPPRGGRPAESRSLWQRSRDFYPRPPRGGRRTKRVKSFTPFDFYPRPPRGGRLGQNCISPGGSVFLPTPSARRATKLTIDKAIRDCISTHALREEGDNINRIHYYPPCISTHALREEGDSGRVYRGQKAGRISTHALREEGDPRILLP